MAQRARQEITRPQEGRIQGRARHWARRLLQQQVLSGAILAAAPALQWFQAAFHSQSSSGPGIRLKREMLDRDQ